MMYQKHMRKILCQALEAQGKDNQKNWLSLCVFIFEKLLKDGNVVHRWQIFFRLSAGKRGNMYYDIKESGKRIKELRKKAGMTQEGLANRLNISTVAISNMERGVNGVCEGDDGVGKIML
jgi:DNA-binding XRE family transcriptional regulator